MNLLALHLGKNASAALAVKGRLIGAVGQERFNGIKNTDAPPQDAVSWLLESAHLSPEDIDEVLVCGKKTTDEGVLGFPFSKIVLLDKHDCLSYAPIAFFPTTGEPWLVVTADGDGGNVNVWNGKNMTRLAETPPASALGAFYGAGTAYLGMTPSADDYKVMGLAGYARPTDVNGARIKIFKDFFSFRAQTPLVPLSRIPAKDLLAHFKEHAFGVRFDVFSGALQSCLEDAVLRWVQNAIEKTGIPRLMTSGSVFMNVKLNKVLREKSGAVDVRFMPSCGDEVAPLGALSARTLKQGGTLDPIGTLYLGPAYDEGAFIKSLPDSFAATKPADLNTTVAELLAQGDIVARFAGRAEYGARSLGNRAILAHPGKMESFYKVNDGIKRRDFWMPFAPTILDVDAPLYFANPQNAPASFMIDAFEASTHGREALCSAMHQGDGTLRPQVLARTENPAYYALIEAFRKKTSIGAVLNTSLNLHGEPLATSPAQALSVMRRADLRFMIFGPWLIEKM